MFFLKNGLIQRSLTNVSRHLRQWFNRRRQIVYVVRYEYIRESSIWYENYDKFELTDKDEAECNAEFRFEKSDLPQWVETLRIPHAFKCKQRTVCDGMEWLCMLLRRMAYLCRYSDLIPRLGKPVPKIFNGGNDSGRIHIQKPFPQNCTVE